MREHFIDSANVHAECTVISVSSRLRQCEHTMVNIGTSRLPWMLAVSTRVNVK